MKPVLLPVMLLSLATFSWADVVNFEAAQWSSAQGQASHTESFNTTYLYNVTLSTNMGVLTHSGTRGIGIDSAISNDEPDEIETPEVLTVTFNAPAYLNSFRVENLYFGEIEAPQPCQGFGCLDLINIEVGQYNINGQLNWTNFAGTESPLFNDGSLNVTTGGQLVSAIRLTSVEGRDEFSLSSMDITPTPEPAALWFMGTLAAGTFVAFRRRKLS